MKISNQNGICSYLYSPWDIMNLKVSSKPFPSSVHIYVYSKIQGFLPNIVLAFTRVVKADSIYK